MVSASRLLMLAVVSTMMFASAIAGGGHGGAAGGFGYLLSQVQAPLVQQQKSQPVLQQLPQKWVTPQPVMEQQKQLPVVQQRQTKQIRYAQPIVTYAQPIVQNLDTSVPQMPDQSYTAPTIVQPSFQTAPVQNVQAITATAPTINKGYGSGLGLGQFGGYGAQGGLSQRYGQF